MSKSITYQPLTDIAGYKLIIRLVEPEVLTDVFRTYHFRVYDQAIPEDLPTHNDLPIGRADFTLVENPSTQVIELARLNWIEVASAYTGHGIGSAILHMCESLSLDLGASIMYCVFPSERAKQWFLASARGYQPCSMHLQVRYPQLRREIGVACKPLKFVKHLYVPREGNR